MTTPTKDQLAEVARQLRDAAITLENDSTFYAKRKAGIAALVAHLDSQVKAD